MRHNSLRDLLAELLKEICKDVELNQLSFPSMVKPYHLVQTSVMVQDLTLVVKICGLH